MGSKKRDLEIIYNLQWKHKVGNGGDKANIIGMHDIPATTLNWETFKSYLLKNSGTVGDDVKVSYITDSNREFPIHSQADFQVALYAFRRKARLGDIVNLKLDRISKQQNPRNIRHSNDVETQFNNDSIVSSIYNSEMPPEWFLSYMSKFRKSLVDDITSSVTSVVSNIKSHPVSQPPCYHSRKSKAENSKRRKLPLLTGDGSHETKDLIKSLKLESKLEHKLEKLETKSKKLKEKKLAVLVKSSDSDGVVVSSKRPPVSQCESDDDTFQMDACPDNVQQVIPRMLGGETYLHNWRVVNSGNLPWTKETVLMYTWGSKALKPLDTIVSVPYLKPGETGTISVRLQIPNQSGQYECYFHFHHQSRRFGQWLGCQVIVDPFDLKGHKSVLDTTHSEPFHALPAMESPNNTAATTYRRFSNIRQGTSVGALGFDYPLNVKPFVNEEAMMASEYYDGLQADPPVDKVVRDLTCRIDDIKLQDPTDTNCSSDSDNQSIVSLTESNNSKDVQTEYVVVPIPDCFQVDEPPKAESVPEMLTVAEQLVTPTDAVTNIKEECDDNNNDDKDVVKESVKNEETSSTSSHKSDIVMVSLPGTNQDNEEYACVLVDGQKVMIPKKIIKSEYLKVVDKQDTSIQNDSQSDSVVTVLPDEQRKDEVQKQQQYVIDNNLTTDSPVATEQLDAFGENDFNSHCSAAGSCFSDALTEQHRVFIFPQNCPGYELMTTSNDIPDLLEQNYETGESKLITRDRINLPDEIFEITNNNPFAASTIPNIPNYQQTLPELRRTIPYEDFSHHYADSSLPELVSPEIVNGGASVPPEDPQQARIKDQSEPLPSAPPVVHILPEGLVSGAVNVARSVINRIVPQPPGRWVNGHWVSTNPDTPREANLQALAEMGFWNRDLNATLLARYDDDLSRVVAELVQ